MINLKAEKLYRKIIIISLKFAPGLYKEFRLIGDKFGEKNFSVSYILSEGYREMISSKTIDVEFISNSRNLKEVFFDSLRFLLKGSRALIKKLKHENPQVIYFYNIHPLNILFAILGRAFLSKITIIFHLHEPFQPDKSYFTKRQRVIVYIQEYLQKKMVFLSDCVVTPSSFAEELFRKYYPTYNRAVHTVPLCIPDSPGKPLTRSYAVMPGHMFPDGRVDDFCALLENAAQNGCSFRFKVVTSSDITNFLRRKLSDRAKLLLDIVEKRPLSDEEINEYVANAFAVLSMHTRGSQSGVTPVAFMNGTPVVARNIPMFSQFVIDGVNGKLVAAVAHPSEWIAALEFIKSNVEELSKNARESYIKIFHEDNLQKYLQWMIEI
jgi:glycosyltransferase involved in cell wall biosynthesis